MRPTLITLLVLIVPLLAESVEDKEVAAIKAEYAKRAEVARRPVRDWFALEVSKKEKAYIQAGNSAGAALMVRERIAMIVCPDSQNLVWTWTTKAQLRAKGIGVPDMDLTEVLTHEIVFQSDGTGIYKAPRGSSPRPFQWTPHLGGIKLNLSDRGGFGQTLSREDMLTVKLDSRGTTMKGDGVTIRVKK